MLNMAVPVPAFDIINIDPSIMLGISKCHLQNKEAYFRNSLYPNKNIVRPIEIVIQTLMHTSLLQKPKQGQ